MQRGELEGCLREALIRHARVKIRQVRDEDVLTRDLGFDSFALLNVVLDLEDRLHVEIDPDRLANLREITFARFVDLIGEHLAASEARPGAAS